LDHDLAEFEKQVCKYAIKSVASVADTILIHTKSTSTLLGEAIGLDVSSKCKVVEHPLYEELLSFQKKTFPKEFDPAMVQGKKVILSLGMIRPYKGVSDLLIAYDQLLSTGQAEDSCLVIAGHMLDDDVRKRLEEAKKKYPDRVFAVPRKLSEEEMAALYSVADLAAMPYKAILISGSYYLATTFSVPSIVPNIGMFIDEINHGVTGLKYEPGGNGLLTALKNAISKNKNELKKIGDQAFQTYKYRTSAWFSKTYFECVLDKNDNGSKKA
jgi:glycosyltransferase involved in cell wall biosynthesis